MKIIVLILLNLFLLVLFIFLLTKKELLTFRQNRRWWLTWLAIGIITLMDEFTSIFYVPAEAYRFIGPGALVFIAITSLLIRFMSTRFTEIGEILERNDIIGGGVYSFLTPVPITSSYWSLWESSGLSRGSTSPASKPKRPPRSAPIISVFHSPNTVSFMRWFTYCG
jgi:phosphoglycerol transferase MdoB-like AlkP superfamily enzyme